MMKKVFLMLMLLAVPFAMQSQTVFHDAEANEAQGAVKKISQDVIGHMQVTTFTQDGKMQREELSNASYDANGYLQSFTMSVQGQSIDVKLTWKDGKLASQSMEMMGSPMVVSFSYNDKGAVAAQSINMGGQEMKMEYTDYKYDAKGNWVSRKTSMMGQEIEQTRTIEYFE